MFIFRNFPLFCMQNRLIKQSIITFYYQLNFLSSYTLYILVVFQPNRKINQKPAIQKMSLSLNDEQTLSIIKHLYKIMEREQNQKVLDIDQLESFKQKSIKPLYPHKNIVQNGTKKLEKYSCSEICCQLSSGSTCCACFRKITPPDHVYQQFGLGMNIYFNFIKHFAFCLFFLALFAGIAVALSIFISISNGIDPVSDYQTFFFSTTMGSFSSGYFRCRYESTTLTFDGKYTANFDLNCPQGKIFQFGPVITQKSQETLTNCKIERSNFQSQALNSYIPATQYTVIRDATCNQNNCKLTVKVNPLPDIKLLSFPYGCEEPSYNLFRNNKPIQVRVLTYIFVGLDLFITLGLMFFICSQKQGESEQIDHFKDFQLSLKDFSVKVKGFKRQNFDEEFHELIGAVSQRERDFSQKIIQIKVPDDEKYLQATMKRRQMYEDLFDFMERNFFDNMINPDQYHSSQQFVQNTFNSLENYLSFKNELENLLENYKKASKSDRTLTEQINIYLVFNSSSDVNTLKRMRQSFCCGKYLVTKSGQQFSLQEAPISDMLQWANKPKWTCLRILISWILTLAIVAGSFLLFGYVQWQEKQLLGKYDFGVDCTILYPQVVDNFAIYNSSLSLSNPMQYNHCYCSSNYFSLNVTEEVSMRCSAWWNSYLLYILIPLIISIGLVIYNLIVSIIFKKLTQFESHFFITDEMFSYIIKRSFILIMNMGLIVLLLNFDYFRNSTSLSPKQLVFLFQGKYTDITSDWYLGIGSIIVMTMIFNISYPFMELLMASGFKCLRKCFDKRCWSRKTSQKYKIDYINLYSSDVYPIQERYSIIVSIFWILMLFGCVMPALYIIVAISVLLLVIIDKVLLFKFFKTPINFDESLHKKVMKTLYIGLMLHLIASAFLLSQPNLVPKNSNFSQISSLGVSSNQRLNTLIQTYYIIPYVGLFLLMLFYAVFKQTIIGLLSRCNKRTQRTSLYKVRASSSFYESLTEYQLLKLKVTAEKQILRLNNLKRQKMLYENNLPTQDSLLIIDPSVVRQNNKKTLQIDTQLQIYSRTLYNIQRAIEVQRQGKITRRVKLIGMPGYEMLLNEVEAQKDKKMLQLDSVLQQIILRRT